MAVRRRSRPVIVPAILAAGLFAAACGAAPGGATGAAAAGAISTRVAAVGSGAACIPDLNTTHVSVIALQRTDATGVVPSGSSAEQVREGGVPAPPLARLLTRGRIGESQSGSAGVALRNAPQVYLYQTSCGPNDVQAYYVAVLNQNQWTGEFLPASGAAQAPSPGPATAGGADVTLFDLNSLATGRFVNLHPRGTTVAFISIVAAIVAPGTANELHPTYVQIVVQPSAASAKIPILPPTVATTPDVGASAAPPGGGNAP